jgi:hypothetical protein
METCTVISGNKLHMEHNYKTLYMKLLKLYAFTRASSFWLGLEFDIN